MEINTDYIENSKEFWNVNTIEEAKFLRIWTEPKENILSIEPEDQEEIWQKPIDKTINQIFDEINFEKNWSILEIGCGVGRIIKKLRRKFIIVDGVDFSKKMVEFSKKYLSKTINGSIYLNNGYDLSEIENEKYNFIYSYLVFQHIRSYSVITNYFKEAYRVLKKEGVFRFQVIGVKDKYKEIKIKDTSGINDFENSEIYYGKFNDEAEKNKQYGFSGNIYTEKQLRSMLVIWGFKIIKFEYIDNLLWVTCKKT